MGAINLYNLVKTINKRNKLFLQQCMKQMIHKNTIKKKYIMMCYLVPGYKSTFGLPTMKDRNQPNMKKSQSKKIKILVAHRAQIKHLNR